MIIPIGKPYSFTVTFLDPNTLLPIDLTGLTTQTGGSGIPFECNIFEKNGTVPIINIVDYGSIDPTVSYWILKDAIAGQIQIFIGQNDTSLLKQSLYPKEDGYTAKDTYRITLKLEHSPNNFIYAFIDDVTARIV